MFDIESIQSMFESNSVKFTQHFKARIKERGIRFSDVEQALQTGEIIEQSLDAKPLPSILIFGYNNSIPIHVVVSVDDDFIFLVTAYYPSAEIWEPDYKTRKVVVK